MQVLLKLIKKTLIAGLLFTTVPSFAGSNNPVSDDKNFPSLLGNSANAPYIKKTADSIYDLISLGEYGLEKDIFFNAYKGFQFLRAKGLVKKSNLLTIIDYSQSSNNKRLYVVDILNSRLLFNTYVSHGKNSGDEYATSFSNYTNSNKSSLGFMITGSTYSGVAGLSLVLNGMEPGINDKVKARSIVLHGSRFVNESVMSIRGVIGKSYGCPAVPYGMHFRIIDAIKGGSVLFVNHPDKWYATNSTILNARFDLNPAAEFSNLALQPGVAESGSSATTVK